MIENSYSYWHYISQVKQNVDRYKTDGRKNRYVFKRDLWVPFILTPITMGSCYFEGALMAHGISRLRWRHNDHDGVSNHQPHGCLLNRLFRRRSKKTSKLRVTGLCVGNSPGPVNSPHKGPVTSGYAENVSIWWRHHADRVYRLLVHAHRSREGTPSILFLNAVRCHYNTDIPIQHNQNLVRELVNVWYGVFS